MSNDRPLVSAIIPVCNGERYLAEAIESILIQQYEPLELIVVDDGSTDGTAKVVRRFTGIRYDYRRHAGIGSTRNRGLALAQGERIAFLDADDVWLPNKLRLQSQAFVANPDVDVVTGHVEQFHSPELDESVTRRIHCPRQALPGYVFGAALIKRRVFEHVGPISEYCEQGESVDWCIRAKDLGVTFHVLDDVVMRRRLHETNYSQTHRHALGDYAHALKASLDRRRRRVS